MYPDYTSQEYQRHSRHCHHTVVYISHIVDSIWQDLEAEQRTTTEELAHTTYQYQNHGIAKTVADTIDEAWPRTVCHGESLKTTHEDTVGDDKSDVDRKLYANIISKGFEHLANDGYQSGNNNELYDNTNTSRNGVADDRDDNIRECCNHGYRKSHHDGWLQL